MQIDLLHFLLLVASGIAAGFVNTMAGGGSVFTVPALMLLGMPADVANGTNRIGVLMQSVAGVRGFRKYGKLDQSALLPIPLPTVTGSLLGSLVASYLPPDILKPVLLGTMLAMTLLVVLRPSTFPTTAEQPFAISDKPAANVWLFVAGVYGGFVQAGVGFILLTALAGVLRYDLVRANAMKMVCSLAFTLVALAIFLYFDQVRWMPGLILAAGNMLGTWITVRFAVKAKQSTIKWFLFVMTLCSCIAALIF